MNRREGNQEGSKRLDRIHHVAVEVPDVATAVAWCIERFACDLACRFETWSLLTLKMRP